MAPPKDLPTTRDATRQQGEGREEKGMREGNDSFLPLKNGSSANVRHALAEWRNLERLLRLQPRHFDVLLSLSKGEQLSAPPSTDLGPQNSLEYLKGDGTLLEDGTVRPIVRDVLLSGFAITPDGPAIHLPFAISNDEQRRIFEDVGSRTNVSLKNWLRDVLTGSDDSEDRSR